jgi:hypothetical protein
MSATFLPDSFQIVHVLGTELVDKTKKILTKIGSVTGEGQTDSDKVEWWQQVGFASRPAKPNKDKEEAAGALVLRIGRYEIAFASQDNRTNAIYGALADGETCMFGGGEDGKSQGRVLIKKNGSVNIYTRAGNAEDGDGMLFQMDAENDTIRCVNSKGYGFIIDGDGFKAFAGGSGSCLTLDKSGKCSLVGTGQAQVDGSTVLLGSIAAPVVNAVCVGPAGLVAVASSKVLCALA